MAEIPPLMVLAEETATSVSFRFRNRGVEKIN